jgi:hypothetical protein
MKDIKDLTEEEIELLKPVILAIWEVFEAFIDYLIINVFNPIMEILLLIPIEEIR